MPSCVVNTCKNNNRTTKGTGVRYFRFPKNKDLFNKWVEACTAHDVNLKYATVCSVHFEQNCYLNIPESLQHIAPLSPNARCLLHSAVPTQGLPKQNESKRLRVKPEVELEVKQDMESEGEPEMELKIEPLMELKIEPEMKLNVKQEMDLEMELKVKREMDLEVEPEVELKVKREIHLEVEPKMQLKIVPLMELQSEPEVESEMEFKVEPEIEIKMEPIMEAEKEQRLEITLKQRISDLERLLREKSLQNAQIKKENNRLKEEVVITNAEIAALQQEIKNNRYTLQLENGAHTKFSEKWKI